jgi:predicted transcriptional regulator
MSSDDTPEGDAGTDVDADAVRDRVEREADRAVDTFDESVVDVLSWVLDTETRARIYVYLRANPERTSDEVAEGTGLYPSTVREALARLHEEGTVMRTKRESGGAGNNPYEYSAMAPSDLVSDVVEDVQSELNAVFNLDDLLGGERRRDRSGTDEPVTITVEAEDDDRSPDTADGTG